MFGNVSSTRCRPVAASTDPVNPATLTILGDDSKALFCWLLAWVADDGGHLFLDVAARSPADCATVLSRNNKLRLT